MSSSLLPNLGGSAGPAIAKHMLEASLMTRGSSADLGTLLFVESCIYCSRKVARRHPKADFLNLMPTHPIIGIVDQ